MRTLFYSEITEYEKDWGQRPDGFMLAEFKTDLEYECN
jgi:hypothetical protein